MFFRNLFSRNRRAADAFVANGPASSMGRESARRAGKRNATQRRMRLEKLLNRELLAADFGAIGGTVFSDLQGNGFDAADPGIAAVTVSLFRDTNSNGTFEPGTDANVGTDTTDANGAYLFDRLSADRYFVQQTAAPGRIQEAGDNLATVIITEALARGEATTGQVQIDSFDGAIQQVSDPTTGAVTPTSSAAAAEAVGGERDLLVNRTSAGGTVGISVNGVEVDVLAFSSSLTGAGLGTVQWDGVDGDATTLDPIGLRTAGVGIDFTNGDASGLLIEIGADQPANTLTLRIYTDAANFSTAVVNIPDLSGTAEITEAFTVPFSAFAATAGAGATISNVGAIEADITIGGASDIILNVVGSIAPGLETVNFRNAIPLTLGDLVFNDTNNNGLFDTGETGIDGVSVNLFEDTNSNGQFDPGTDAQIGATATTAGGGLYQFANLFPGDYFVQIPPSQFALGSVLNGFQTSLLGTAPPDPDNNINNDDNGAAIAGQGVVTPAISLVSLSEPIDDGDADNNTNLTLDLGFAPQVDVSIIKTVLTTSPVAGQPATYRLTVNNAGPQTAGNVVITDTLPAGVTFQSATRNGTDVTAGVTVTGSVAAGQILTFAPTTMTNTQTDVIDITVAVPAGGTGAFNNVARVVSDGVDTVPANNESNVDLNPARIADLLLEKTASATAVAINDDFSYTITVTNNGGPSTATGVTVTDVLPAGINFNDGTITRGGVASATGVTAVGNTVTAAIGDLAIGESVIVTLNVTAVAASIGPITNNATVTGAETDSNPDNNSDTADITVNAIIDLVVDKRGPANAIAGNQLVYTIDVTNNGPATATGVAVLDTLPAGVTFVSGAGTGAAFDGATTPGEVQVTLPNIAPAQTATFTITVAIPAGVAGTTLTNTAAATANETELPATLGNESDTVQTPIVASVDLSVVKTGATTSVVPGNQLVYTIVVDNIGPSNVTGAVLEDTLPAGVTLVSIFEGTNNLTTSATTNGQVITLPLGSIPAADAARTLTFTVNVAASVASDITNTVLVRSNQQAQEISLTNNNSSVVTTVTPNASLVINKTDNVDPATPGGVLVYTITVQNTGPSDARDVVVTDALPAGVVLSTTSPPTAPGGTVTQVGNTLTLPFGTIAAGATASATVTVQIPGTARGQLSNTVNVTGTGVTGGTLSDTEPTALSPIYDVTIVQMATPTSVAPGSQVTFDITVSNAATSVSTASGVTVTDTLPAGLTFASATLNGAPITSLSNIAIPDLAPGASATIQVLANVGAGATNGQVFANTANIVTAPGETDVLTNTSSANVNVDLANRSISGRVVIDSNFDNQLAATETGLAGTVVVLTNAAGAEVARVTTGADGDYSFNNLTPGNYTVTRMLPSAAGVGGQNLTAINSSPGNGSTAVGQDQFTVNLNGAVVDSINNDFGVQYPFSKWIFFA